MANNTSNTNFSFDDTEIAFKHQNNSEIKKSFWLFKLISHPLLVKIGPSITKAALYMKFPIKGLIKATIFKQFCGGETIQECTETINKLEEAGVGTILDYSIEGEEEEYIFDLTAEEIINTINKAVAMEKPIPFCVFKITGVVRFALLQKVNTKEILNNAELKEWNKAKERVEGICKAAFDADKKLMIDAEESWVQLAIDDLALEMMRKFNKTKAIIFNTYQLYRHDKLADLKHDLTLASAESFFLGVKLVRGAYMEKERKRALEMNYISPIQPNKIATDNDYDAALSFCLENINLISFVAGTHNQQSCLFLTQKMEALGIQPQQKEVFFSQLLGMSDNLSFNLSNAGYQVAKYVPYGPVKAVLPYLFRRAEENTAIAGQMGRELSLITKEMKRRQL